MFAPASRQILTLVPLTVVYLVNSLLSKVRPVDCFSIIVGYIGSFTSASNRVILLMNKSDKLFSLLIGDLHVLSNHELIQFFVLWVV